MVELFTLDRVQSKPAQFDFKKFEWMNAEYMKSLPAPAYEARFRQELEAHGLWNGQITQEYFRAVIALMRERVKLWDEVALQSGYFFTENYPLDQDAVRKRLQKEGVPALMASLRARYAALPFFDAVSTEAALREEATAHNLNAADLIHPLRVTISGLPGGPSLFHLLEVLGRDRVLARLGRPMP
jgi:glutamyl-tRNA synthetase